MPNLIKELYELQEVEKIVITQNIPEPDYGIDRLDRLVILKNKHVKGFGANHNNAFFLYAKTPYFAVINPDIRFCGNVFPELIRCHEETGAGLTAPSVVNSQGLLEDSVRSFPTFRGLLLKILKHDDGRLTHNAGAKCIAVPWVAGMFMLLKSDGFANLNGFDEDYFLYYEDVDLCARMWKSGQTILLCPSVKIVHDARRASHRNPRHMLWHATSMFRYFIRYWRRLPKEIG